MTPIDLKAIGKVLQEANRIEQYQKILDLIEKCTTLQEENSRLKKEIEKTKEITAIKKALFFENDQYWLKKDNQKEGPFCSRCWDKDKALLRMLSKGSGVECPDCKNFVITKETPRVVRPKQPTNFMV